MYMTCKCQQSIKLESVSLLNSNDWVGHFCGNIRDKCICKISTADQQICEFFRNTRLPGATALPQSCSNIGDREAGPIFAVDPKTIVSTFEHESSLSPSPGHNLFTTPSCSPSSAFIILARRRSRIPSTLRVRHLEISLRRSGISSPGSRWMS